MANREGNSQPARSKSEQARLAEVASRAKTVRLNGEARNARGTAAAVNPPLERVARGVSIALNRIAAFITLPLLPLSRSFARRADRQAETGRELRRESRVAYADASVDVNRAAVARQENVQDNTAARIAADEVARQEARVDRDMAIAERPTPVLERSFERPMPS